MGKKVIFFQVIFFIIIQSASAQKIALTINDSLKKNANVVKRVDEIIYEIKSPGRAKLHKHHIYTILNEQGDEYGYAVGAYNKFADLNTLNATLYDALGKEIKHVKKKDMADQSASDEETLMTDTRFKAYGFGYKVYPYSVEVEEDDDIDGMRDIDDWNPQQDERISVESSRYVLIAPKDYQVRFKGNSLAPAPVITDQGDKKVYTWEVKNLTAKKEELYAPRWKELVPYVMMAPSEFEAEGYKGSMATWESFGKFINTLLAGKNILPDAVKQKVHELTDKITDPREKVKVLYNFMQQNTRYISIQFGIGGWQPFDANYVYTKRYGDCKALSNYMVAMLREAGVKAYYVLINAGEDAVPLVTDFSCNQFNHATVCVPMPKDTLWLECTNQTLPAGYIGSFTGNRMALLIDENGGHVVNTKKYVAADNLETSVVKGSIDGTGKLTANIINKYAGYSYYRMHSRAINMSKKDQLTRLKDVINLPVYDVTDFNYEDSKSEDPSINENVNIVSEGAATVTGKRLFFSPNFLTQSGVRLQEAENRKFDVVYSNDFIWTDSLEYQMPAGYSIEAMAKDVVIKNKFGSYEIHFKVDADKVLVNRRYERNANRFSPDEYNNLVKFYDDMYKADRSRIVFVKKDS